jgi:alpha-L-rhamnosidase
LTVSSLTCESALDPVGVEEAAPRLGWVLESEAHDARQQAYRVLVATTTEALEPGKADLWDSGRVESGESVHVTYGGKALGTGQRCHWKVQVWDPAGNLSDWSRTGVWEMGLLHAEDWQARWIGSGPPHEPRPPAGFHQSRSDLTNYPVVVDSRSTLLRKQFAIDRPVRRATAYVTGLGYYELTCNGRRVGDRVLAPAKTNYRKWVLYDILDLTELLRPGTNVLGLHLGNGWFNPAVKWWDPYRMQWFGSKRALLQLHIEDAQGRTETVISDHTWRTTPGPVLSSCVYDGEVYDATQEIPGWDQPGFDDRTWAPANEVEAPGGQLVAHRMPPIRVVATGQTDVSRLAPDTHQVGAGNHAGWLRLTFKGTRGTRVTIRYAEDALPDGHIDTRSNEKAQATDVYVLRGAGSETGGWETYEPRFTFHGFAYAEVSGYTNDLERVSAQYRRVHSDCAQTGSLWIESTNRTAQRLHAATVTSQADALMGYPMDCPQRDERLGWLGDAMVTAQEAMFNFDMALFYQHWLDGIRRNQNPTNGDISIVSPRPYLPLEPDPTWSSAYLVVVWEYYRHYGDRRILETHFDAMRRYVDYLGTQATNNVLPKYWIGDWGSIVPGWQEGDPPLVGTAFYYYDTRILAKAARVLGRQVEAAIYERLAQDIRTAFNRAFYDPQQRQYDAGRQFGNAFALYLDLVPPADRSAVLEHLIADIDRHDGHLTGGVLSAKFVPDALALGGRPDVAWRLINVKGYPGWADLIEQRTTLSEFWDKHGSHNHVMLGSVDAWLYRVLAGIETDEDAPGFARFQVRPFTPDGVQEVKASVMTVRGRVRVKWWRENKELALSVQVPVNSEATIHVPAGANDQVIAEPTREPTRRTAGAAVYRVGSGNYLFRVPPPPTSRN